MKKLTMLIILLMMSLCGTPAFALFVNGGFETGDLSGWDVDFGVRDAGADIDWDTDPTWTYAEAVTSSSGLLEDFGPYSGSYMAQINDLRGRNNATKISQTDTISQQDIDDGAMLYVNWGALLVEPSNAHPANAQPYFGITVTAGGDTQTTTFDALTHDSATKVGHSSGDIWYTHDTWSFDLGSYDVGTEVEIEMVVADCDWGAHGGYALLDGIGTLDPTDPVPEPSSILLMATGLLALLGFSRKQ